MQAPTEPILASTLWTTHQDSTRSGKTPFAPTKSSATGSPKIDTALGINIEYGSVYCISGESDSGAREFTQALLISHLLSSPVAKASLIDSSFLFDVRSLHLGLMRRGGTDAATAAKVLDRVEIMKVFDVVGVTESLAELRDGLAGKVVTAESAQTEPRGTIEDSEEEDEMLDDLPHHAPPSTPTTTHPFASSSQARRMLIIDTITQVVAAPLKNNYVQGQALLSTIMRSLAHLTAAHNLCTVILNGASPGFKAAEESPSAFSSCNLQPALGKSFANLPDVHLLVHQMTKKAEEEGGKSVDGTVSVIEVLHDRYGGKAGRWAAFAIDDDGLLVEIP